MHIDLSQGAWENAPIVHAWAKRFPENGPFTQKPDCVENKKDPAATYGYENIALMTEEKFGIGAKITVECEFEDTGAPMITISEDLERDENGDFRYGTYYELVLYKKGINLWRHYRENGEAKWYLVLGALFSVSDSLRHTLSLRVRKDYLDLWADGQEFSVRIQSPSEGYYLGLTSCEGINRFYSMDIEA